MTEKYVKISKIIIAELLDKNKDDITIFDISTVAMAVVERVSGEKKMTSEEKKKLAKELLVVVVDVLVELGKISPENALEYKHTLEKRAALIDQFIDIAAYIGNHPTVISAKNWVIKKSSEKCGCVIF